MMYITADRGSDHGRWAAFDLEGVGNGVHIGEPDLGYPVIKGTSGDDDINVKQVLIDMGYDPNDRDLEIRIEDSAGHDIYDLTNVAGDVEIYDGEGDDDYFTNGGNDNDIRVKEFGYGDNTYYLNEVGLKRA